MRISVLVLVLAAGLLAVPPLPAQGQDPLVDQVRRSIERGVNFLKLQERGTGSWDTAIESKVTYPGGWTSLALLALLSSGVAPDDPIIQRGLKYLREVPPSQTYVVGLQTMVFAMAGEAVDRERIQRNVDWLLDARLPTGWTYTRVRSSTTNITDNSNTQYALLGLHEGIRAGARVSRETLEQIRGFYINTQRDDGGWVYRNGGTSTMTMTTAGVCGLLITGMDLAAGQQRLRADGSAENCGAYLENKPVARGMEWIGTRFPSSLNSRTIGLFGSPFYCLYGIERTGRLTGQRFFHGHDWYRLGCEYLVGIQKADGSWVGEQQNRRFDHQSVVATSFSLLFLSKGRTPVLITKMAHGRDDGWNNKRSDVRHVVDFASRELFRGMPLAWQVFDVRAMGTEDEAGLRRKLVEELLPSPILYLNGHYLRPSDREKEVIREYLNNGGFLFAEACCGDRELFDRDFRALVEDLYGEEKVELKPVPADHPVWTASGKFAVPPNDPFPLYGIQYGCKWVAMYSPRPLAGYWEADQHDRGDGKVAFQLAANVIAYATGLVAPRPRLSTVKVPPPEVAARKVKRGYLEVGQLAHQGDWRPAPRAMRNLMEEVRRTGLDVVLTTSRIAFSNGVFLDPRDSSPVRAVKDVGFFYLHGRRDIEPSPRALEDLRFRLQHGGLLLADACCGAKAFDTSFRRMMETMWAGEKLELEPIPAADVLYSRELNGEPIRTVRCRRPVPRGSLPELQEVPPALEGIKYNGRWVVIYSKYDLGCALEGHSSSDCLGHDQASALRLGKAAVLYSLVR